MKDFTSDEAKKLFLDEFKFLEDRFILFDLSYKEAKESKADKIWNPGVYVWFEPEKGVIKVGHI